MWLKINYKQEEFEYEIFKPNKIHVSISNKTTAPIDIDDKSIRISKIFPLDIKAPRLNLGNCYMYFFDYSNPYSVLGKIKQKGSSKLINSIFFGNGQCSIILISENKDRLLELKQIITEAPNSHEKWIVENGFIKDVAPKLPAIQSLKLPEILDYSSLKLVTRTIIDEFYASIKILEQKIAIHDTYNSNILDNIITVVNESIIILNFLRTLKGAIPEVLNIYNIAELTDPLNNQILRQQSIDRLTQINASISYVSTQSYSGSIPILERRSLIRRYSLLGVGSSIRTLNRVVDYIENAFNSIDFVEVITNMMLMAPQLKGIESLPVHNRNSWSNGNIDKVVKKYSKKDAKVNHVIKKFAYFSSRLGFRETEFSITASLNSIPAGLSLEWTLMTITHEMLHSFVRIMFTSIFYGSEHKSDDENYNSYYENYKKTVNDKNASDESLIDSIRNIIINYCLGTNIYGSLTIQKEYLVTYKTKGAAFRMPKFEDFHPIFLRENRNLNEIFVHVLDFHYFYRGRAEKYIPLIWLSWSSVPHINADIRQYILRSLIVIASNLDLDPYERWEIALRDFKEIISQNNSFNNIPLIKKLIDTLANESDVMKYYFGAFKNSMKIVDLVKDVFYSESIRAKLWDDDNITYVNDEDGVMTDFIYTAPNDFIDLSVKSPIPYLFDRMTKILNKDISTDDVERLTTMTYLAMNSNS